MELFLSSLFYVAAGIIIGFGLGWGVSRAAQDDAPSNVIIDVPGLAGLIAELRSAVVRLEKAALTVPEKVNVDTETPHGI